MVWLDRVRGLLRTNEEIVSETRHRLAEGAGADTIGTCADRGRARLRGTVSALTVRPKGSTTWLEAQLDDGTGQLTLIWMGRREIPGITAGRDMIVQGRVSDADEGRRMYNPRYQLL